MNQELQKTAAEIEAVETRRQEIIQDVRGRYPNVIFPDVYRSPLWYGRSGKEPIKGYSAIIGAFGDEEHVYANSASEEYLIVNHEESIYQLERSLAGLTNGFGKPLIKEVRLIDNGAKMRTRVEFPECELEVRAGKKISPRIDNWNSYDLSKMYGLSWGAMELVCSNGMVAYRVKASVGARHRQDLNISAEIEAIMTGIQEFGGQVDEWKRWGKIKVAKPDFEGIMEVLPFGTRHTEKILALPQTGSGDTIEQWLIGDKLNLWEMHSIMTQFLTHEVESELVRVKKTEEVAKVFHEYAAGHRN